MIRYWPLYLMIIVFISPAMGSYYILYVSGKIHSPTKQHGTLQEPATKVTLKSVIPAKWNVLYSDKAKETNFNKLHIALGAHQDRVVVTQDAESVSGAMIVDPQGMYILHYPDPLDMSGMLKDLRRLLKYSHV